VAQPLRIWRLSDARRGHDNQSQGLVDALSRHSAVICADIPVNGGLAGAVRALVQPSPDQPPALVLGAGHATHLALLITARRHRARSIVLMNPSVPRSLFDLCIIPRHDGVPEGGNVLLSLGALNRVQPGPGPRDPAVGLVLVGGPSRHHGWDEAALVEQVRTVLSVHPQIKWQAAGSPRTPVSTLAALRRIARLRVVDFEDTTASWLPGRLAEAAQVWVSEDSVSMAYEAVSSGAPTGILALPAKRPGRVHAALNALVEASLATPMAAWLEGTPLDPPAPLQEADRCARAVLERWPDLT